MLLFILFNLFFLFPRNELIARHFWFFLEIDVCTGRGALEAGISLTLRSKRKLQSN